MPKTLQFQDIHVPAPGFGAMGMSQSFGPADDTTSKKTLARAVQLGCTFWDTAVVYGKGHNEGLIGEFIAENAGVREKLFIASKCGFDCLDSASPGLGTVTNKPAHIATYIEGTRERLGSYPDLYYLHRIDPDTPLEESIPALQKLKEQSKCRYIGLSECSAATLRKACEIAHIDALQIEYSPLFPDHESNGLIAAAKELGVAIIAYSPTCKGMLSGKFRSIDDFPEGDIRRTIPRFNTPENFAKNLAIIDKFGALAAKKGCTPAQLSLAWVMSQGAIPIPGTRVSERLEENFAAGDVVLSDAELKELRELIDNAKPAGDRYAAVHMAMVGR